MDKNDLGTFIHNCSEKKVNIDTCKKSLFEVYNDAEIKTIYSFYLNDWSSKANNNQKDFSGYGWQGMSGETGLNKLEGLLLEKAGIQTFCMKKTKTIKETLLKMNLNDEICVAHPRAVMIINNEVVYTEDSKFEVKTKETRMACLFRHIRNALAHNLTYSFDNGNIMLEDMESDNNNTTARILLKKETLLDWIKIIENKKEEKEKTKNEKN